VPPSPPGTCPGGFTPVDGGLLALHQTVWSGPLHTVYGLSTKPIRFHLRLRI
jgi:hypothetical protein